MTHQRRLHWILDSQNFSPTWFRWKGEQTMDLWNPFSTPPPHMECYQSISCDRTTQIGTLTSMQVALHP